MRSFFKAVICVLFALSALAGCVMDVESVNDDVSLGTVSQSLDSAHTRVIQECSQAMTGSWWTYNETNWPTGTTYGTYAYISSDLGAWGKLLDNTYNGSVRGWWTSCRRTSGVQNFSPCSSQIVYGDLDTASLYDSQSGYKHGGQCKPFMNLVAYRSGKYQGVNYAWKSFPSDGAISTWSTAPDQMPWATYANIVEGDYLRRTTSGTQHAAIVVRKISSSQVVVMDSNWVNNGDGYETIGSHMMGFTGSGGISDLGSYRVLKCAYTGGC